jgi:dTDP-4-dehydrorhamnose reductase
LARIAVENGLTLVHVSSEYVFDGTLDRAYREDDAFSPLGVYAQTKAAGDCSVATVPRHYIVRTSWVVGQGGNFVGTMASLAQRGVDPKVVEDQVGRLTFAEDLAHGIRHLLDSRAQFGTYNLTGSGDPMSWADVARQVFILTGHDPSRVRGVSSAEYFAGSAAAPRPRNSVLDLSKISAAAFRPTDSIDGLRRFLATAR